MQALGDLWVDARVLRPAPWYHAAKLSRRLRITCSEERHVVAPRHEPFGQERGKELPRSVVARGDAPGDRREYRDAHRILSAPTPGADQTSCPARRASPSSLPSSP